MFRVKIECITEENRKLLIPFIKENWHDIMMVIKGEQVDISEEDGFCILDGQNVEAVVTYRMKNNICEITLLHTAKQQCGIGTRLVQEVIKAAREKGADTITVVTTNDNIGAIAFYQKIGFDMEMLYRNSMDYVRKLKPTVPAIGDNNIPLRHEIEFAMHL